MMPKFKKILMTLSLFLTLIFTSVAPVSAFYGGLAWNGKIWPPVLTGWHVVSSAGSSGIDWTFSDPNGGVVSGGIPNLSSQYPDWNKPNNMDIVMWAQNHHIQTPLNSIFGWTAVDPGDTNPNYTGPIPCSYTPEILAIIQSSGHSPTDFFNAGKAPLTASTPAPAPAKVATTTPTKTATPEEIPKTAPVVPAPPAPVVAVPQVPVAPQVAQDIAQKHSDPEKDSSSMVSATVTKLDDAKQAVAEKAKTDAYNRKFWWIMGGAILVALFAVGLIVFVTLRERGIL